MAFEPLTQEEFRALTQEEEAVGAQLLAACDRFGLEPEGMAWLWIEGRERWELWIASCAVEHVGNGAVSEEVLRLIKQQGIPGLTFWELHFGTPRLVLFHDIAQAVAGRPLPAAITDLDIDDLIIEHGHVYRMGPPIPDAEALAKFDRFKRAVADLAA